MRIIKISDLKVGDKLPDNVSYGYGRYVDNEISGIRITKGGRYVITYNRTYINEEGVANDRQFNMHYSNGALSGNTEITIL